MTPAQIDEFAAQYAGIEVEERDVKKRKKELVTKIVAAVTEAGRAKDTGSVSFEGTDSKLTVDFRQSVTYTNKDALAQLITEEMDPEQVEDLFRIDYKEKRATMEEFLEDDSPETKEIRELLEMMRQVKAGSPSVKVKRFSR